MLRELRLTRKKDTYMLHTGVWVGDQAAVGQALPYYCPAAPAFTTHSYLGI